MSEVYFVRHGQASYGSDNYDQLSPLGHQQAIWLGEYFAERDISFNTILMGDMVRHRETTEGICQGLGIDHADVQVYPSFNEFDFQALTKAYLDNRGEQLPPPGTPVPDFYRILKKALLSWSEGEVIEGAPETWDHFEQRTQQNLALIQERPSKQKVLVVSSGGAISMALRFILKAPAETMVNLNLQTRNTGISHCYFNSTSFTLNSFNHTPHLDSRERREHVTYS